MKRRILAASLAVLLALTVISFSSSEANAAQTFERVNFISGVVTANELNLRNGPSMDNDIIGTFKRYKWLNVLAQIGDWYAVFDPDTGKVGCVAKAYLADASTIQQQQPQQPGATTPPATSTPAPATPAPTGTTTGDLSQEEQQLLSLINQERAKSNLSPLQADAELMKVARIKAEDMSKNNYFSHYSPTYGSPFDMMRQFGITFKAAAENIAWLKSEGHRRNIMSSTYNYTGIGIAKSNKYGYLFVQMFIKK